MPEQPDSDRAHLRDLYEDLKLALTEDHKHKPLGKNQLKTAGMAEFIPVIPSVTPKEMVELYLEQIKKMEMLYTQWRRDMQAGAFSHDARGPDKLNDKLRAAAEHYHEHGGLSAVLTRDQMEFALEHGMLMMIALRIREDVSLTVGAVLVLGSSSDGERRGATQRDSEQRKLFDEYDARELPLPSGITFDAPKTAVTLRSMLVETPKQALELGFGDQQEIPDELLHTSLRRLGLPAAAKGALIMMMMELNKQRYADTRQLLTHIGLITTSEKFPGGYGNDLGGGFNYWMDPGNFITPTIPLDPVSGLRMMFRARQATIGKAKKSLLGQGSIVSGKGVDIQKSKQVGLETARQLQQAIDSGAHAPWSSNE